MGAGGSAVVTRPSARPKPDMAMVSWRAPPCWPRAPTRRVPRIGPVQEKETMARVSAIKKIPPRLLILDLLSTELVILLGSVISNRPKNDSAKTRNTTAKVIFNQILVEISFRIFALLDLRK